MTITIYQSGTAISPRYTVALPNGQQFYTDFRREAIELATAMIADGFGSTWMEI